MGNDRVAVAHQEKQDHRPEFDAGPISIHSPAQTRRYLAGLVVVVLLLALPFPWLIRSSYVGSATVHGMIEMCAALIGLAAGVALMARFYALANRFYLFAGLALFVNGAEDFVHGFAEFASHHGWIAFPHASLDRFIPGTYVTGRILMAALLIWAALAVKRSSRNPKPKRETIWASLGVLAGGVLLTVVAFLTPLPRFIYYGQVLSRPIDLASAVLFAVALAVLLNGYVRTRRAMIWWLCLSAAINVVGQFDMSFSRHMYDALFDMAHVCKVLGYLAPLLGFSLCQVGVIRDGKRAREALAAQKEHLAVTLHSIGDGVIATDTSGRIVEINPVAVSLTEWTRDAALGRRLAEVFHIVNEETGQCCEDPVAKVLQSGIVVGLANHTALISRNGTQRSIADSGAPIRDQGGNILGVVLVFRDVTEKKRAEAELAQYREHLERMVEQRTGELRHTNEQLRTEASERERAEKDLRKSEEQTRFQAEMLRNAPVIAAFHDTELNVVWANKAYEDATGLPVQTMVGRKCYSVWGLGGPCRNCPVVKAVKTGEAGEAELTPQNQEHWPETQGYWLSRAAPVRDADGRILGAIEIAINITDKKRAEEALKEYSQKLEEMVEMRTKELRDAQEEMVRKEKLAILGQLAGGVGHELRNPLGAIKNAAYFLNLSVETPTPEVKETIQILDREVATCERIISGLLNFARPKATPRHKVDAGDVIAETLSRVTVPSNIEVVNRLDRPLPAVLADPDQLVQVFGNILLNAFQAMPQGGRMTLQSAVPSPEWVALSFTDTGDGIAPKNLTKIFEPLFTTKAKGIGFGLAVTKSIVEAHGGSIEVQSEVGKGTTFTVRLPVFREEA